ncbi:MAG: hypothetical protein E6Q75_09025 [Rheinheimera sp.]|nr:MAG: hypothetical protein E6Q75_09025 [Rheinheimera sp.]
MEKILFRVLGGLLLLSACSFIYLQVNEEKPAIPVALAAGNPSQQPRTAAEAQTKVPQPTTPNSKVGDSVSEGFVSTKTVPQPADFVQFDGEELVLKLNGMKQLNDAGRIDSFAKALRAEARSDASLAAERQLTELLQTKVQTFRQSALSRIDCGEYFCLVVAPVQQQDELFNEFLQHSKPLHFGSGSFYNFQSNGELYNSLILSLKANTSIQ